MLADVRLLPGAVLTVDLARTRLLVSARFRGGAASPRSGSGSLGKEVTPSSTYIRIVNAVGCFRRQPYIKIRAFDIYFSFFFRIAASQTPISRYETDGPPGRPQILHRIIGFVS